LYGVNDELLLQKLQVIEDVAARRVHADRRHAASYITDHIPVVLVGANVAKLAPTGETLTDGVSECSWRRAPECDR